MKQDILQEAASIFDIPEKWRAFYDMQQAYHDIINHWLAIGMKALQEEFGKNPGEWECATWGPRDLKWHLSDLSEESINIGIGWETFELHLFDARYNDETWKKSTELLEKRDFRQLLVRIGPRCYRASWQKEKLLLADLDFDPLGLGTDSEFRSPLIAWHAAHRTEDFVEVTLRWLRGVMEDKEIVRLIRLLHKRSAVGIAK